MASAELPACQLPTDNGVTGETSTFFPSAAPTDTNYGSARVLLAPQPSSAAQTDSREYFSDTDTSDIDIPATTNAATVSLSAPLQKKIMILQSSKRATRPIF
jgi:hypothetical protein